MHSILPRPLDNRYHNRTCRPLNNLSAVGVGKEGRSKREHPFRRTTKTAPSTMLGQPERRAAPAHFLSVVAQLMQLGPSHDGRGRTLPPPPLHSAQLSRISFSSFNDSPPRRRLAGRTRRAPGKNAWALEGRAGALTTRGNPNAELPTARGSRRWPSPRPL